MSLTTVIQRRAHSAGFIRRHVSSKASPSQSHRTLPSAKMRALISLYHQSENFITPENLSQRIDDAFVPLGIQSGLEKQTITVKDLDHTLNTQRRAPKVMEWDQEPLVPHAYGLSGDALWSSRRSPRELKVIEALYGVDTSQPRKALPGLEVLEDSRQPSQQSINDDWEALKREALQGDDK